MIGQDSSGTNESSSSAQDEDSLVKKCKLPSSKSYEEALNTLKQNNFKNETSFQKFKIKAKIGNEWEETNNELDYKEYFPDFCSILLIFQWINTTQIYWKNLKGKKFHYILLPKGISDKIENFCGEIIYNGIEGGESFGK